MKTAVELAVRDPSLPGVGVGEHDREFFDADGDYE